LTLEELYIGCTKKMRITRQRRNDQGEMVSEPKVVEVPIKAGYKAGTKITFEGEGDDHGDGTPPADIIFEIVEAKHPRFVRRGDDLIHKRSLTLTQALCGTKVSVLTIDNTTAELDLTNETVYPGMTRTIKGKGMTISKSPGSHGDLIVEFDVTFPRTRLTPFQKAKIEEAKLPTS